MSDSPDVIIDPDLKLVDIRKEMDTVTKSIQQMEKILGDLETLGARNEVLQKRIEECKTLFTYMIDQRFEVKELFFIAPHTKQYREELERFLAKDAKPTKDAAAQAGEGTEDAADGEAKPAEVKPGDAKPAEGAAATPAKPAEAKPGDAKPAGGTAVAATPGQPGEGKS